ncbi:MAG: DUF6282 family protein [Peptoniphilus lacydonensis]|uniref:DUF6282 family protein n=1 Tax=Peptoniphilaceae TaxID=1570339 RepID=UPI0029009DEB|nr:DUF6282 family protein [Peptoniphilus lacydonensis]MDU1954848.1 DUF6282 family protein [Peptoniphilus lacydonensis]MDU2114781.1 DUF6282 family protein [Peptoniphilus lacydonensis]MDU5274345.1 DUF6282 family protein [Peptoniphilus lacydonensis]
MKDLIKEIIEGSYDLHVHSSPSHIKRTIDDIDLIKKASVYKMEGVMIKNHYEPTSGRAELINRHFDFYTKAYGGIALNTTVGGINPCACESALKLGAKIVWLPTRDAANSLKYGNMKGDFFYRKGISIIDENGELTNEIKEVIEVIKKYDATIATGHISLEESIKVCNYALQQKVKVILTHPDWTRTKVSRNIQIDLGRKGVLIEKVWANLDDGDCCEEDFLSVMKELNFKNIFITTDRGYYTKKPPFESLVDCIEFLVKKGVEKKYIERMLKITPKFIVEGV